VEVGADLDDSLDFGLVCASISIATMRCCRAEVASWLWSACRIGLRIIASVFDRMLDTDGHSGPRPPEESDFGSGLLAPRRSGNERCTFGGDMGKQGDAIADTTEGENGSPDGLRAKRQ